MGEPPLLLPPKGNIILLPAALALLPLVLFNEQSAHCAPLNAETTAPSCSPGEIFLKAHVKKPGCYPLVHLHQECSSSRQCIDQDSFCGFSDHHHHHSHINATHQLLSKREKTVCTCSESTKEVDGRCVVRHHCSIGHFNRDYLQADCPHASMYCTFYRCLCQPDYTYSRVEDDCLPEQAEEEPIEEKKEKEMTTIEDVSETDNEPTALMEQTFSLPPSPSATNLLYQLDPVAMVGLLILAFVIGVLLLTLFYFLLLKLLWKIKCRYSRVEGSV